jgi:hypothetical protein
MASELLNLGNVENIVSPKITTKAKSKTSKPKASKTSKQIIKMPEVKEKYIVGFWNKPISMNMFQEVRSGLKSEDILVTEYQKQLLEVDSKGSNELKNYRETLTTQKAELKLKKDGYLAIITEKYFQETYWDEKLEPYLKNLGFVPEFIKKEEPETKKNKDGIYETVNVMHVYVKNNLVNAKKENLPYTLQFILKAFDITDELKTEIESCLDTKTSISDKTTSSNEEMFKFASEFTIEALKNKLINYQGRALKIQSSMDFINWKLTQIKSYNNAKDQVSSNAKLEAAKEKTDKFLRMEVRRKSLENIVTKVWGN